MRRDEDMRSKPCHLSSTSPARNRKVMLNMATVQGGELPL